MLLQALEHYILTKNRLCLNIWSFENIKSDLYRGLPLPRSLIDAVFSNLGYKTTALLQLGIAAAALGFPNLFLFVALLFTHLIICVRFRGTFNGGSDMMTVILLTGVIICLSSLGEATRQGGLLYISIHSIYSYFKAGVAKVVHRDWRTGHALTVFLERSPYADIRTLADTLGNRVAICFALSWGLLIFELSIVLLPFFPQILFCYFLFALLFHFTNSVIFGLNRFFWIWLAAWPAIFYAVNLAHDRYIF